ncbi:MAG TPA: triose-phosphate isomerase [Candidatus Dormibacteraeota bacterium]
MTEPRRPLVAGNWKMHTSVPEALNLVTSIRQKLEPAPAADVVLLPPFISIWPVQQLLLDELRIEVGAQDGFWEKAGAFTGQVSAEMLRDSCQYLLAGHSERRQLFGDTDEIVRRKLDAALRAGLRPLLAVGETASERAADQTVDVLRRQVRSGLTQLEPADLCRCVIAYEPVWAIGSGQTALDTEITAAVSGIRQLIDEIVPGAGVMVRVLYGGSVTSDSAPAILNLAGVDGALVGGASLDPDEFCAIVAAAEPDRS